jgi:hypothetical protein
MLNGAAVSFRERRDAEIRYLQVRVGLNGLFVPQSDAILLPAKTPCHIGCIKRSLNLQNIVSEDVLTAGEAKHAVKHRRYAELRSKYGDVLATASRATGSAQGIAATMLGIKLTCVATSSSAGMGTHEKKLPAATQLQSLQLLCEKLFKVPITQQALFVKLSKDDPMPEELRIAAGSSLVELGIQVCCP